MQATIVTDPVGCSPPHVPDAATTTDTNEPYLVWLEHLLSQPDEDLAKVISTSYDDGEQTVPLSYATRVCNDMAQIGARGVPLLFASGDEGVGFSGYCNSNDGTNRSSSLPEFPSSCPFVTSIGSTMNFTPDVVAYKESNGYASGGGFSAYFSRPLHQDGIIDEYV